MRPDSGTGSGRSRTLCTTENSAVFAPMHNASVSAAVTENGLSFHSSRTAPRRSRAISAPSGESGGRSPLFDAQRDRGIDARRPPRGDEIGGGRHHEKNRGGGNPRNGVGGGHPVQHAGNRARGRDREKAP